MSANSSFNDCVEITDDMEYKEGQEGGEIDEVDVNGENVDDEEQLHNNGSNNTNVEDNIDV